MSKGAKYPLEFVERLAATYLDDLRPYCEPGYLVVLGSVRRKVPKVGDLDVMLISKPSEYGDLFGGATGFTQFEEQYERLRALWGAREIEGGPKKKTLQLDAGLKMEIHLSNREAWAVEMVIHTGPEKISHGAVTIRRYGGFLPSNCVVRDGWKVFRNGKQLPMLTEGDFLALLGFPRDLPPEARTETLKPSVSTETV